MEEKDYIDITPRGVERNSLGQSGRKTTVFQESEWKTILENPGRLTAEGVEAKIKLWKGSSNKHVEILYNTMKARCKKLAPSGKTDDGRMIFSRKEDGTPHWCEGRPQNIVKERESENKKK